MALPDNLYRGNRQLVETRLGGFILSREPQTCPVSRSLCANVFQPWKSTPPSTAFHNVPWSPAGGIGRPKNSFLPPRFPRVITHQKVLANCQGELSAFLKNMEPLGDKLGPLLLQFPYFNKNVFRFPRTVR